MEDPIYIDSINTYNKLYAFETLHPLVAVVDLSRASQRINHVVIDYGVYALFLKQGIGCDMKYGRNKYDYADGTIVSFAPGQVVEVNLLENEPQPKALGLLFHPDLIRGTSLGEHIRTYGFFDYSSHEALHLSERERAIVVDCLNKIRAELEHAIDNHSRELIVINIELLLNYCLRFYERQFITRSPINKDVVQRFEKEINSYWASDSEESGLPKVAYFAEKMHLSSNYFGDLIKKETGKSPQEYIQYRLIERAKDRIVGSSLTMSQIAYELGFQYPQHFGRMFKKYTGMTPTQYRTEH